MRLEIDISEEPGMLGTGTLNGESCILTSFEIEHHREPIRIFGPPFQSVYVDPAGRCRVRMEFEVARIVIPETLSQADGRRLDLTL